MSYQERRAIVLLVSNVLIAIAYAAYMIQRYPQADAYSVDVFRFWGAFVLILIPVSIAARIVIYILFSIANAVATREVEPTITDERDRLVELRSTQYSLYVFALGFLMAMASLVVDLPPTVMFTILFCAGVVSQMVSDISEFLLYRRGF